MNLSLRLHVWKNDLKNYWRYGLHAYAYLRELYDQELNEIQQEISNYLQGGVYCFAGAALPANAPISPDMFFNVLLPHATGLGQTPTEIEQFYKAVRIRFSRLHLHQDVVCGLKRVEEQYTFPAHGFPYFREGVFIEQGDTVLDCGAAPGDFSAVAVAKGAEKVFAFEPDASGAALLEQVSNLNFQRINVSNLFVGKKTDVSMRMTSIDDFVESNQIAHIDLIKMDIEGGEPDAIHGAKKTIETQGPRLAICTYHCTGHFEQIKDLVLQVNPQYRLVDGGGILYGWIPAEN